MKRLLVLLTVFGMCWLLPIANACADDEWTSFLSADSMPNAVNYLPAPPDVSSVPFNADYYYYQKGKAERGTPRGAQALSDAVCSADSLSEVFSVPMKITLSRETTPKIYSLIGRTGSTAINATRSAKKYHARQRPYAEFKEPSMIPSAEIAHNPYASYPSGHSAVGWAIALLLAEIDPANQDDILLRGYEYGESRVIAGYHYESDVNMARLVASATIARLHANQEFLDALQEAKLEFQQILDRQEEENNKRISEIKAKSSSRTTPKKTQHKSGSKAAASGK